MKSLFWLNKYFVKYKWHFILGVIFIIISNVFGAWSPVLVRKSFTAIEALLNDNQYEHEWWRILFEKQIVYSISLIFIFSLIRGVFMYFMRQTIIVMSRWIEYDLKNAIFAHYQTLDTSFYKMNKTGDIMARLTEDVSRVRMYLGPSIMYLINLFFTFIIVLPVMFSVNHELAFYTLIPLPILSISIYFINSIIEKKSDAIQKQLSEITSFVQESFAGIRVVKSFAKENAFLGRFTEVSQMYRNRNLSLSKVDSIFGPSMAFLIGCSTVLCLLSAEKLLASGKIETGNIPEFILYLNMLTWPVTALGWTISQVQRAAVSQGRIIEFLSQESRIKNNIELDDFAWNGNIEFVNVSFTYPETGIEALKHVSFRLNKGDKMAIVGKTASGKSTILELIMRKYDVSEGKILLDGKDIRSIDIAEFRKSVAYVPQDAFLFSDSIRNNISFGLENALNDDVIAVAQQVNIHTEIENLTQKYETIVGERGITLSGGQKQRISIARALLKNPKMLLLDDSLSAVDTYTDEIIFNSIVAKQCSIINVTHRVLNLHKYDVIIVLKEGKIIEQGNFDSLMNPSSLFNEFYQQQVSSKS